MKSLTLLSLSFCLVAATSLAQVPDDYSFSKTFKVSTPAKVSISTNDGFIHSFAKNTNEVKVYFIVKRGDRFIDIDLEELEEHIYVDISHNANRVDIAVKRDPDWKLNWRDRYNVSFHVIAPANTAAN